MCMFRTCACMHMDPCTVVHGSIKRTTREGVAAPYNFTRCLKVLIFINKGKNVIRIKSNVDKYFFEGRGVLKRNRGPTLCTTFKMLTTLDGPLKRGKIMRPKPFQCALVNISVMKVTMFSFETIVFLENISTQSVQLDCWKFLPAQNEHYVIVFPLILTTH